MAHTTSAPNLGPNPLAPCPPLDTAFLKTVVDAPNIDVGDYSYYHDPKGPENFVANCVKYHFEFLGDRLIIGKFCAIATDAQFIMNGANHVMKGFSTFPFNIFGHGWDAGFDPQAYLDGSRGDTVIGHDVWIGTGATIMPGVTIGNGAVIGAGAVVAKDVPAYAVIAGNPAQVIKQRFSPDIVARLERLAWWDWPIDTLTRAIGALGRTDITALTASGV